MGRHTSSGSKSHYVQRMGHDCYRIGWTVDRYYSSSRLRFPTQYSRDTDEAGAKRFCEKWGCKMPENTTSD